MSLLVKRWKKRQKRAYRFTWPTGAVVLIGLETLVLLYLHLGQVGPIGSLAGLSATANGGEGGEAMFTPGDFHGPGGGGGGGIAMTSAAATTSVLGGIAGVATIAANYGATGGTSGATNAATPVWQPEIGAAPGCFCRTTAALIAAFQVEDEQHPATVTWSTVGEANSAAFRLLRLKGNEWVKVGGWIGAGSLAEGGHYEVLDYDAPTGPNEYRLMELGGTGRHLFHGPFVSTGKGMQAVQSQVAASVQLVTNQAEGTAERQSTSRLKTIATDSKGPPTLGEAEAFVRS